MSRPISGKRVVGPRAMSQCLRTRLALQDWRRRLISLSASGILLECRHRVSVMLSNRSQAGSELLPVASKIARISPKKPQLGGHFPQVISPLGQRTSSTASISDDEPGNLNRNSSLRGHSDSGQLKGLHAFGGHSKLFPQPCIRTRRFFGSELLSNCRQSFARCAGFLTLVIRYSHVR